MNLEMDLYDGGYTDDPLAERPMLRALFWLRYWMVMLCGGARGYALTAPKLARTVSRYYRRLARHGIAAGNDLRPLKALMPRGLSPTQRLEYLCRVTAFGRVALYGMNFWGSVLLRRARLICYDHGWWRAPISRLRPGLWLVYLRPN